MTGVTTATTQISATRAPAFSFRSCLLRFSLAKRVCMSYRSQRPLHCLYSVEGHLWSVELRGCLRESFTLAICSRLCLDTRITIPLQVPSTSTHFVHLSFRSSKIYISVCTKPGVNDVHVFTSEGSLANLATPVVLTYLSEDAKAETGVLVASASEETSGEEADVKRMTGEMQGRGKEGDAVLGPRSESR